jgi:hypothetical protein
MPIQRMHLSMLKALIGNISQGHGVYPNMRNKCTLVVTISLCAATCAAQFFPKNSLDERKDDFKAKWYSHQLQALNEPSLWEMKSSPSTHAFRFLWLRTFHHPIAVRIELKPDGTGILTTKVANGAGGYSPGTLTQDKSRTLAKAEVDAFLVKVEKSGFWAAPNPVNDQEGTDGSQWIIEGVRNGKYHVVDRWSPSKGVAHDLGMLLAFDLAKLNIPANEIY